MERVSILLIGVILFAWTCSSELPTPPISVTLSPNGINVHVTRSVQFTATVHNSTNRAVTWSLSGAGCSGPSCGTISNTGLYTAPDEVPNPASVTIKATSVADPSKSTTATLTLHEPVVILIDPQRPYVTIGETRNLLANVYYAVDSKLTWSVSGSSCTGAECGTISAGDGNVGIYIAPLVMPADPVITITATSVEDPEAYCSVNATIRTAGISETMWTWASGSDRVGQIGNYGTKGIPAPSNVPGARVGASSWLDPSGNLWLFGGEGPGPGIGSIHFNDLWIYDVTAGHWTWVSGSDLGNQPGLYGTKGIANPLNVPGARKDHLSWSDPSGRLWLFGGIGYDAAGNCGVLNDLWVFDLTTLQWAWMSGSDCAGQVGVYGTKGVSDPLNIPGARSRSASWIDASGKLWLFGGWGFTAIGGNFRLNDLWSFDTATSEWTWVSGTDQYEDGGEYGTKGVPSIQNVPGARCDSTTWIDASGKLWLFGGYDYWGFELHFNDLWRFDPTTLEWTWVSGSDWPNEPGIYGTKGIPDPSNVPGGRSSAVSWLDPSGNFWLFGGKGRDIYEYFIDYYPTELNDVWRFDPATLQWTWISGSDLGRQKGIYGTKGVTDPSNHSGVRVSAVSWIDASGRFWLWGGGGRDSANDEGWLNDLWNFIRF